MKVTEATSQSREASAVSRGLERELWQYFEERALHVPAFRSLVAGGTQRVSLLNLAEHLIRLWGPAPKTKRPTGERRG